MSVVKSKRQESNLQFLYTARELEIYTLRKSKNFPKRYSLFVDQHILNPAARIYECVKKGNSIYPLNQHEVQKRRDYFLDAVAELQSLVSQIEVAKEVFELEENVLEYWMALVDNEIRLVKAVLKSDRERYKKLP